MSFNEEIGEEIANAWFLAQMVETPPPSVAQLYAKLHEAAREASRSVLCPRCNGVGRIVPRTGLPPTSDELGELATIPCPDCPTPFKTGVPR